MPVTDNLTNRTWFGMARLAGGEIELTGALHDWDGSQDNAMVLVMDESGPTEWILLEPDEVSPAGVHARLGQGFIKGSTPEGMTTPEGDLTIAICTKDRPQHLEACLRSLLGTPNQGYPVVVIDNAPRNDDNLRVVERLRDDGLDVRRLVEPIPGVSRGRNLGLREIETEFIVWTDDDTRPDPQWASRMHQGFSAGERVGIVTGLVPPGELETIYQSLFESRIRWSTNLNFEVFSMEKRDQYEWAFPYSVGHFGTGANFAVRRVDALSIGGMDTALGGGTRASAGEDGEFFVRMLRAGYELVYQPAGVVWHIHRRDEAGYKKSLYEYGKGLTAALMSEIFEPGRMDMLKGQLEGARSLGEGRREQQKMGTDLKYQLIELKGVLAGPFAYLAERFLGARRP